VHPYQWKPKERIEAETKQKSSNLSITQEQEVQHRCRRYPRTYCPKALLQIDRGVRICFQPEHLATSPPTSRGYERLGDPYKALKGGNATTRLGNATDGARVLTPIHVQSINAHASDNSTKALGEKRDFIITPRINSSPCLGNTSHRPGISVPAETKYVEKNFVLADRQKINASNPVTDGWITWRDRTRPPWPISRSGTVYLKLKQEFRR